MVIINTVDSNTFELNGIEYAKIFQPLVQGSESVGIYGVYDTRQQILNSTNYSQFEIDGSTYANQAEVVAALIDVIWNASGGTISGGDNYNAKSDFGAVGDGTTDDTAALQAALDAAAGSKPLYIPEGTYRVEPLSIESDTYIFGAGMGKTTIKFLDNINFGGPLEKNAVLTNANILPADFGGSGDRNENIFIFDLTIDGNRANQTDYSSEAEGLSFYGAQNCYVDKLELLNAVADGYDLDYCDNIGAGYLRIDNSAKSGVHFSVGSPQGQNKGNDNCWIDTAFITNTDESALTDAYYGGKGYNNRFGNIYVDTCGNETGFTAVTLGGIKSKLENLVLKNVTGIGLRINNQTYNAASDNNVVGYASFENISGNDWEVGGGSYQFWAQDIGGGSGGTGLVNLASGLIEAFDMNETSGTRSGLNSAFNLSATGSVGSVAGVQGNAANFSTGNYLSAAHVSAMSSIKAFSFWVKFDTVAGTGIENAMVAKDASGANEGDFFMYLDTGQWVFSIQGTETATIIGGSASAGQWYHVVATTTGSNTQLYVDGELIGEDAGATNINQNTNTLEVGVRTATSVDLDGAIDMLQFWSKNLNLYEVLSLNAQGRVLI